MASTSSPGDARYQPGSWFGIIRRGTVVLLGPETPSVLVGSLWDLLASAPQAHEVLNHVTDAFGVSLSRIPPFGIIDAKDQLRVFLRGDLELTVRSAGGFEKMSGRDVTTWTERRITSAEGYSLLIGSGAAAGLPESGPTADGAPPPPGLAALPVAEGAVRLGSLEVILAPASDNPVPTPRAAAPARVSDETVLGYTDSDLGLTIAPHTSLAQEDEAEAEAVRAAADAEAEAAAEAAADAEAAPEVPVHTGTTDPNVPTLENTTNYDHLWDKTVMRNIEDAAVRIDEDADGHDLPAAAAPVVIPVEALDPSSDSPEDAGGSRAAGDGPAQGGSVVVPGHGGAAPGAAAPPAPIGVPALIDSVPWLRGGSPTEAAKEVAAGWPVAVTAPEQPVGPESPAGDDPDHDGQTVMKGSVAAPVQPAPATAALGSKAPSGAGPSVLARVCPEGHANPPTYSQCAACGRPLSGDAVQVPRPRLGRVRLSTGELIDLDQSLIIGRQPSVSRVQGATMPRLVQVESPGGDISRSHVEVRLEGWHVMLCDLKATNGTVLIREGQAPRRLAQNEMAILLDGDIAELGDDISLRFEEIL